MQQIGRRIYYDKLTGNIVQDIGEMQGSDGALRETTTDEDFQLYKALSDKNKDTVGIIQLNYGELSDKFSTCTGFYVDITKNPIDASAIIFTFTTPEASLEQVKQTKINEMNTACQNAIINTFQSSAYDGKTEQAYSCKLTDQSRINGLVTIAQLRLANLTTEPINYYQNKDVIKCVEWQPQNMLNLGLDLKRHIEKNTDRYENLKVYIGTLTTVEEVQKVTWDTQMPTA